MAVPQELATQEGGASPAPTKANPRTHTQNRRVGHPAISEQITAIRKLGLGAILNPRAQPGMAVPPRPENPRAHAQNRRVGHPETGPPEGGRYKNQKTQEGGVKPPLQKRPQEHRQECLCHKSKSNPRGRGKPRPYKNKEFYFAASYLRTRGGISEMSTGS